LLAEDWDANLLPTSKEESMYQDDHGMIFPRILSTQVAPGLFRPLVAQKKGDKTSSSFPYELTVREVKKEGHGLHFKCTFEGSGDQVWTGLLLPKCECLGISPDLSGDDLGRWVIRNSPR
jgi:hypothetical protein